MLEAAFCFSALLILIAGCARNPEPQLRITNIFRFDSLNALVLNNFTDKRIVMMGDRRHGTGYYMRLVTGVLDSWVSELENERRDQSAKIKDKEIDWATLHSQLSLPKKLFLFVEQDSGGVAAMDEYFQTGDPVNMLTRYDQRVYFAGLYSVDWLEYLNDLRHVEERVEKLNAQDSSRPYDFRLVGPEIIPQYWRDYKLTRDTALSRQRLREFRKGRVKYDAQQRDGLTSESIRHLLDANPQYKALIFYGDAHLGRGKHDIGDVFIDADVSVEENSSNSKEDVRAEEDLPKEQKEGYYLVHYLDQYFSRDSVSTFVTGITPLREEIKIIRYEEKSDSPDYIVLCKPETTLPFPLEFIRSQNTLLPLSELRKKYIEKSNEQEQIYYSIYTSRLYYQLKRSYLNTDSHIRPLLDSLLTDGHDSTATAKKRFTELSDKFIERFDAVQNIDSLEDWMAMPLRDSTTHLSMLKAVIENLPSISEEDRDEIRNISLGERLKTVARRYDGELKEYLLVGLMWVGNTQEQDRARSELERMSGFVLRTPKEWSNWWRSKYIN